MRKILVALFMIFIFTGIISATLEGAAFGFAKDMSMSYLSSQNPVLGQAISFVICPQCAITSSALGALDQVVPGASQAYGFIQNPEGAALALAKQNAFKELTKDLNPKEQMALNNIQKFQPYIKEAFETNPDAPKEQQKGTIEIDEDGNTIIKNSNGKTFAKIPPGFEAVESEEGFTLKNKEGEKDAVLEIKNYKISLDKNTTITFSEKDGISTINLEGQGDFISEKTILEGIEDATIRLNENEEVTFAKFTSVRGGFYEFDYNNQKFVFNTNTGSKVLFDPEKGKISGENTLLKYKDLKISGDDFEGLLDKEGNFKEMKFTNGFYQDKINNLEYSSTKDFSLYLYEKDISNKGHAISVFDGGIKSKGLVKIENGFIYEGLTDSTIFEKKIGGDYELFSINGNEDRTRAEGGIATFIKKVKVRALSLKKISEEEVMISSVISRESGKIKFGIDENSLGLLVEIEKDPTRLASIEKNLLVELGDKEAYFGINTELGMLYEGRNNVNLLDLPTTKAIFGERVDSRLLTIKSLEQERDRIQGRIDELMPKEGKLSTVLDFFDYTRPSRLLGGNEEKLKELELLGNEWNEINKAISDVDRGKNIKGVDIQRNPLLWGLKDTITNPNKDILERQFEMSNKYLENDDSDGYFNSAKEGFDYYFNKEVIDKKGKSLGSIYLNPDGSKSLTYKLNKDPNTRGIFTREDFVAFSEDLSNVERIIKNSKSSKVFAFYTGMDGFKITQDNADEILKLVQIEKRRLTKIEFLNSNQFDLAKKERRNFYNHLLKEDAKIVFDFLEPTIADVVFAGTTFKIARTGGKIVENGLFKLNKAKKVLGIGSFGTQTHRTLFLAKMDEPNIRSLDDLIKLEDIKRLEKVEIDEVELNRISNFIQMNPKRVVDIPEEFLAKLGHGEDEFMIGLDKINKGLVKPDDSSFISLENTGIKILEDSRGNSIVRYGNNRINLNDPNLARRQINGRFGVLLESDGRVETIMYYHPTLNQYRVDFLEVSSLPRIDPSIQSINQMSRKIDNVLTQSKKYVDIQIEEGNLLRLRSQDPTTFDEAMKQKYHKIEPEVSASNHENLLENHLTTLSKQTGIKASKLEITVEELSTKIKQDFVDKMPQTHTTTFKSLEDILKVGEIKANKISSSRDAMKGVAEDVFFFRNDPGSVMYGDVMIVMSKNKFGSETIHLPGDLRNGIQKSIELSEDTMSFGTKVKQTMYEQDADELLSEYIAGDIINRKITTGQSLEQIIESSISKKDIYRYYLSNPVSGGSSRVNNLNAIGRIESHTSGKSIEGATIVIESARVSEIKTMLEQNDLLGKVKVIGVDGKWGKSPINVKKAKGGSNEVRTNVFSYLSGIERADQLTDLGDNIYRLKLSQLPDISLKIPKTTKITPLLDGKKIMEIREISSGKEVGKYIKKLKEWQEQGLVTTIEGAEAMLRATP